MAERPSFYLPDFCRPQSVLAVILIAALVALLLTLARHGISPSFWTELAQVSLFLLWAALGTAALWCAARGLLSRLDVLAGSALALALALAVTAIVTEGASWLADYTNRALGVEKAPLDGAHLQMLLGNLAVCAIAGGIALRYFYVTHQWQINVEAEAQSRVRALQARIRPHFLINSINAVLSLIREEPKRAEIALEDMADLFRVLMADNRNLSTMAREVELTRQYLELEQLRLGERLTVEWHTENMPGEALIPPLVLQPLVENAVYHGIEPSSDPGVININVYKVRDEVHLVLRNPYRKDGNHHAGNKMALGNIRERLALHFDAEASLKTSITDNAYQVHIVIPYRKEAR